MRRWSPLLAMGLILAAAACQGPAGPPGPAGSSGPAGEQGVPGSAPALAYVGARCPDGEAVVGFDLHGGIVCAGIGATAMPDNDAAPPSLESFSIAPDTVSIADAPGEVRFTARITDDVSGAVQKVEGGDETATLNGALSHARFRAPSGLQFIHVVLGGEQLVSGSAQDGTYEYVATIPQYVERGPWELEFILLVDHAGNQETLTPDVLSERWLPTSFVVE